MGNDVQMSKLLCNYTRDEEEEEEDEAIKEAYLASVNPLAE